MSNRDIEERMIESREDLRAETDEKRINTGGGKNNWNSGEKDSYIQGVDIGRNETEEMRTMTGLSHLIQ